MIVFNGSMEYRICVCAASLVGKERSKETKWSYERVEIAACVVGHSRDYVRRMEQKSCLLFEEINVEVTVILCFWLFRGEACGLQKMWPRDEIRARCRSGFGIAIDIANFGGDVKLFLCVAYWIYLIHIQLGFLGLREIDAVRRLHWTELFSQRECLTVFPSLCCPEGGPEGIG